MAQTGNFTPILLYSSSTIGNAPAVGNLTNSTLGSELAINIADGKLFYKDSSNAIQVIGWKTTPTTAGGTGLTSYTAGDMIYWASGTAFTKLSIGASKTVMTSSGTAPQWSTNLDVSQGGTGLTSVTAGYIPFGNSATALNTNSNFYWDNTNSRLAVATTPARQTLSVSPYLDIYGGTANSPAVASIRAASSGNLVVQGWSGGAVYLSYDTGTGGVNFGNGASAIVASMKSAGKLSINDNLVISTAGKGIDFSATSDGSGTATSEILADYEEGTFTPVLRDNVAGNAATTGASVGRYTKIGKRVFFDVSLVNITTTGLTAANQIVITGLPYATENVTNSASIVSILRDLVSSTTGSVCAVVQNNASHMTLLNNTTAGLTALPVSTITSTTGDLFLSGNYIAVA